MRAGCAGQGLACSFFWLLQHRRQLFVGGGLKISYELVVSFGCYMNWRERAKAARIALLVVSFGCYGLWFFASHPIL